MIFPYYRDVDKTFDAMLDQIKLTDGIDFDNIPPSDNVTNSIICRPDEEYSFLHEAAIISYHGVLYASWYNCPKVELHGATPIRESRSYDGGKTWSSPEVIVEDPTGKILYCPPVYGIDNDKLYLLLNEMVSADHIHALDLYILNEETGKFELLWSRPIPFKLNTNVYRMANGKLLLPGRIAELDGFPNTPAVLISDSGHIDSDWRLVHIQPNGNFIDGSAFDHPEISAVIDGDRILMFCRDDRRFVPIVYESKDNAEHWSKMLACDIPFGNSKIYSGTLSDGRNYVIGNLAPYARRKLFMLLSKPHETVFTEAIMLRDGGGEEEGHTSQWCYPVAYEADGNLYIIYTEYRKFGRGAALSVYKVF